MMKRPPPKAGLRVNDQGTVFDPETGETYTVNDTGLIIFRLLQEDLGVEQIHQHLGKEYEMTLQECKRALMDFTAVLKMYDLLHHE